MSTTGIPPDLPRHQTFTTQEATQRFQAFTAGFAHVRAGMDTLRGRGQALEQQYAPRFNIFRLLGITTAEVRTHSALLADLLNPRGTHGQGSLFLATFLQHCQQKYPTFPRPTTAVASAFWTVGGLTTPQGNLDLVVAASECQVLLVIENKIGAREQPDQLYRYDQWLQRQSLYPHEGKALLYLTPRGSEARTARGSAYSCLSYHEDIVSWLCTTLREIRSPRVREMLVQYLDVITTL